MIALLLHEAKLATMKASSYSGRTYKHSIIVHAIHLKKKKL